MKGETMKKILLGMTICLILSFASTASALVWGVNPGSNGNELVNIDAFTGAIIKSYSLSGMIGANDTEIGLAGYADTLYYSNANQANGTITMIDPANGGNKGAFTVSGGWEIDGLGYYANDDGSWLYTSGCSVDDVHRYVAADGSNPSFYWSNINDPRAMAGDNGGRIFTYGNVAGDWGIYEINPLSNVPASLFASSPSRNITGMAFDGVYLYMSDTSNMLYTMNLSGVIVSSLELNYTLYALASTEGTENKPVPEPATILLLATGLIGFAGSRRKKNK